MHPGLRPASSFLLSLLAACCALQAHAAGFTESRIYIEYNASANDLGFHVSLDGEDWRSLTIVHPEGRTIFEVTGRAAYAQLGMTELFFEGAEPSLDELPLADLLALFPEGRYRFQGTTVDGRRLTGTGVLSHAVPAAPPASVEVGEDSVVIRWTAVDAPPPGFPARKIEVVAYQVLVDDLDVVLPGTATQLTLPPEFVESLDRGTHPFEVLAIDVSGNQTIMEGTFVTD